MAPELSSYIQHLLVGSEFTGGVYWAYMYFSNGFGPSMSNTVTTGLIGGVGFYVADKVHAMKYM